MRKSSYQFLLYMHFLLFMLMHPAYAGIGGNQKEQRQGYVQIKHNDRLERSDEDLRKFLNSFFERQKENAAFFPGKSHFKEIENLVKNGANPNVSNSFNGSTALHIAAQAGSCTTIKVLVAHGADLENQSSYGCTPLCSAVKAEKFNAAELLISLGAKVDTKMSGFTAFDYANDAMRAALIKHIKLEYSLIVAAMEGNTVQVESLIRQGVKIDFSYKGKTALMYAAQNGHERALSILLLNGANAQLTSYETQTKGYSTLMLAAKSGKNKIVKELLPYSNIDHQAENGYTALMCAVQSGVASIFEMILSAGAQVDLKSKGGNTALIHAASHENIKMLKLCLDYGANINHQNQKGKTALYFAAENNFMAVLRFLLLKNADANLADINGFTPLMISLEHEDVVNLLSKKLNEVKIKPRISEAVEGGQESCCICLGLIEEGDLAKTKCMHNFHLSCIFELLNRGMLCPVCRQEML